MGKISSTSLWFLCIHILLWNSQIVAAAIPPPGDLIGVPPFQITQKPLLEFLGLKGDTKFDIPGLYIFGDSTVDAGNNNFLVSVNKANFTPYGVDFDGGKATGRFTNGRTQADFIGQLIGLPIPPPYLSLSPLQVKTIPTGMNFGSAGCGILSTGQSFLGACLPFHQQVQYYEDTLNFLKPTFPNKESFDSYVSKSLLFINIGNADMNFDYNGSPAIKGKYTIEQYANLVAEAFSRNIKRLYNLGARKFLVNNLGAMGCIPEQVIGLKNHELCVKPTNYNAIVYNDILIQMLPKLQVELPGFKFILVDAYKVLQDAVMFPNLYGFTNTYSPCCEVGKKGNATLPCVQNSIPCPNRNEYVFFDAYHLSEALHFLILRRCIKDPTICNPMNLVQFLQA